MKKYIHLIPLIIYPYAYIIFFKINFRLDDVSTKISDILADNFHIIVFVYTLITLMCAILSIVYVKKGKYSVYDVVKMNLIVKSLHIPAYIFHFGMFICGMFMSVWGVGFVMVAAIVDVLTIALSGINAISCAVGLKRRELLSMKQTIIYVVTSFIFCIDYVVAIIFMFKCKKWIKQGLEL